MINTNFWSRIKFNIKLLAGEIVMGRRIPGGQDVVERIQNHVKIGKRKRKSRIDASSITLSSG